MSSRWYCKSKICSINIFYDEIRISLLSRKNASKLGNIMDICSKAQGKNPYFSPGVLSIPIYYGLCQRLNRVR